MMLKVYRNNELVLPSSVVSIGAFDGLHRGHQTLIKRAAKRAQQIGVPSVVYTFNPPPRAHFQNSRVLTSVEEKVELLQKLDIDYIVVADFNDHYSSQKAESFIHELGSLNPNEIWVGPNFQFGKGKKGNTKLLAENFQVRLHPLVTCEKGEVISSTRIRRLLQENERMQVNNLLGRRHMTYA